MLTTFETRSVNMAALIEVRVQMPADEVLRIMAEITEVVPLIQGPYDSNAFQSAPGVERYRPQEGAAAGPEEAVRERPGAVEVSFEIPDEKPLIEKLVERIFQVHCYQEPVIKLQPVLVSRSKGLNDQANPHRWWNTTGDWKQQDAG